MLWTLKRGEKTEKRDWGRRGERGATGHPGGMWLLLLRPLAAGQRQVGQAPQQSREHGLWLPPGHVEGFGALVGGTGRSWH